MKWDYSYYIVTIVTILYSYYNSCYNNYYIYSIVTMVTIPLTRFRHSVQWALRAGSRVLCTVGVNITRGTVCSVPVQPCCTAARCTALYRGTPTRTTGWLGV